MVYKKKIKAYQGQNQGQIVLDSSGKSTRNDQQLDCQEYKQTSTL
jgi:hypothetical protein